MLQSILTPKALRAITADWRRKKARIALVPTMGALHAGHLSLVERARAQADRVVVSIFVNPLQFGPAEDFEKYPRTWEEDVKLLTAAGVDAVYAPRAADMYGDNFSTNISVRGVSEELEGAHRPGHFDGVATVVAKLLLQALPDVAIFGEKDYQQLCVIRRMVADLNIPVEILSAPTLREADGLALSSRNRYLSITERATAPLLHQALQDVAAAARAGEGIPATEKQATQKLLDAGFAKVDYITLRDAENLQVVTDLARPVRVLGAAFLGTTRLIDNIEV